ncbi:hypothetical protein [Brachybacterium hainanense]|uniref:PepSY domain-containing protein n=1 Tax=Brachybacterium hainanense TaxID=1541174 RepID=A0ABV6R9Q7_9MICO
MIDPVNPRTPQILLPTPSRGSHRLRGALLAGVAAALLAACGSGAPGDEGDIPAEGPQTTVSSPAASDGGGEDATASAQASDGGGTETAAPGAGTAAPAAGDIEALRTAAETATAEAGGEGALSIDVERDGIEVEVLLADGSDVDVRIASDGTATVGTPDAPDADDVPRAPLDLATLPDIAAAAQEAVTAETGQEGTIDAISSSDDTGVAYEVGLQVPGGDDVDVDLAEDLSVVRVDLS